MKPLSYVSRIPMIKRKGDYPEYVISNLQYETVMGSHAYGTSTPESDLDIYGFCIPPKEVTFPHLAGQIEGFGPRLPFFGQYEAKGLKMDDKEVDFSIYSIVQYFQLCSRNNPNLLDSLYTDDDCVNVLTSIGMKVRNNRHLFLSKLVFHTMSGFAHSQIHKIRNKSPEGKRVALIEKHGYDIKHAYHVVRVLRQCELALTEGTMDLRRYKDELKSIREGKWTIDEIEACMEEGTARNKIFYENNTRLQYEPDHVAIRKLLIDCLEESYGTLEFLHNEH